MKHHLYVLGVLGSAPLPIPATIPTRRVEVQEDDATPNQGLVLFFPDDNYTQGYTYAAVHEPITLGEAVSAGKGRGSILGLPIQNVAIDGGLFKTLRAADVLLKATSATATATKIRVTEYA